MKKRLYKTEGMNRKLCGVCGGLAEYLDVDPTLVRLGWALLTLAGFGIGFWGYIICAVIMPNQSDIFSNL